MPKQQTVRDVKRISETRKEVKKREGNLLILKRGIKVTGIYMINFQVSNVN